MLMNDNRIRRYGLSPHFIALRGSQSSCNHFPSSWKFVRPDHLAFEHKPCGADLSQVPAWADSSHTKSGGARPRGTSHSPHEALGLQPATGIGLKISEVLVMWFQRLRACGADESQCQPVVPGILQKDICALLYLNFSLCGCRAGGDRTG